MIGDIRCDCSGTREDTLQVLYDADADRRSRCERTELDKLHIGTKVWVDIRARAEVIGFNGGGDDVDIDVLFEDGDAVMSGRLNTHVPIEHLEAIE